MFLSAAYQGSYGSSQGSDFFRMVGRTWHMNGNLANLITGLQAEVAVYVGV